MVEQWIRWIGAIAVVTGVAATPALASDDPEATTVRMISQRPQAYSNRAVRVAGRFRGRLAGPSGAALLKPPRTRWDFLLEGEAGTVWVSGLRPVGRDFDLDPGSPADAAAGHWLAVTGVVRVVRKPGAHGCDAVPGCTGLWGFWIEASDMFLAKLPGAEQAPTERIPSPAPAVVFHDPIADEIDVPSDTTVRVQFSRSMAAETLSGRVRVAYADARVLAAPPVPRFDAFYHADTRGLEIRFSQPLDRGQRVRVELLDGIRALDGRLLPHWALVFSTARER